MTFYKKLTAYISEHRLAVIIMQLFMSAVSLGSISWNLTATVKNIILVKFHVDVNPWALLFYHPTESALANYTGSCICLFLYSLFFYNRRTLHFIQSHLEVLKPLYLILSLILSTLLLLLSTILKTLFSIIALTIVFLLPLSHFIKAVNIDRKVF